MSVHVTVPGSRVPEIVEGGRRFLVGEVGELIIVGDAGHVATYALGEWRNAKLVTEDG